MAWGKPELVRTQEEIDALLNICYEAENTGATAYGGMTYEQGVKAAIEWLTDKDTPNPIEEEE